MLRITVCLRARRKAIRFSSWEATFSATNRASSSGTLISWIVTRTFLPLIRSTATGPAQPSTVNASSGKSDVAS